MYAHKYNNFASPKNFLGAYEKLRSTMQNIFWETNGLDTFPWVQHQAKFKNFVSKRIVRNQVCAERTFLCTIRFERELIKTIGLSSCVAWVATVKLSFERSFLRSVHNKVEDDVFIQIVEVFGLHYVRHVIQTKLQAKFLKVLREKSITGSDQRGRIKRKQRNFLR